jgi:hypothetical protein
VESKTQQFESFGAARRRFSPTLAENGTKFRQSFFALTPSSVFFMTPDCGFTHASTLLATQA